MSVTMNADPDMASPDCKDEPFPAARPYGLFGLVISTLIILLGAMCLLILIALLAIGIMVLFVGWQPTLDRFAALKAATGSQEIFLQRLGIITSIVVYAAVVGMVFAAARLRAGRRWRDLIGWAAWQPFRGARLFWAVGVAAIVYSLGADAIISRLYPPSSEWVTLPKGPGWIGLFIVLAVLFAPAAEELLFRGWLYTGLRRMIGVWAGILVTSVLFALAHWETTHLYALAVFPVGVALGFIRERTGSVKASMTLHGFYNAAASALLIFGS